MVMEWKCGRCFRNYHSHKKLYYHTRRYHQIGHFRCTYVPGCNFSGAIREKLYKHHKSHYQPTTNSGPTPNSAGSATSLSTKQFACLFPECGRTFATKTLVKRHQRFHLKIKPYCCRWPDCGYASEVPYATICHIRTVHFSLPATKKEQVEKGIIDSRNPKDYLEVIHELIPN